MNQSKRLKNKQNCHILEQIEKADQSYQNKKIKTLKYTILHVSVDC